MDRPTLERLIHKMSNAIIQIITLPNALALPEGLNFPPELALQSSMLETVDNGHETPESWSQDQQKLRDIIVHFTSLPEKFVRRHTDLASLGIDSISAIQISALCKRAGLTLSTAEVASSTTMNDLMARLDRHQDHETQDITSRVGESYHFTPDLQAIERKFHPGLSQAIDFISPTLAGMEWLIGGWQSAGGNQFQHAFVLSSAQPLNSPQLKIAWKALTDHHFILRSTFCSPGINESSSAPLLVTFKNYEPDWSEFVLQDSDSDKELDSVAKYASALVRSPPSPQRPPSRLTLLCGRTMCYMILNLHHVQYGTFRTINPSVLSLT
jgi:ferricrocin synthase